ncbi:MAG: S41 family peptidase [Bacteroidetes bacterium]|nr:S41 family peptidase [Bacteroidota bacterium]
MLKKRRFLVLSLVIMVSFSVGFITHVPDNYFEISKNLDIFGKLYREINSLYVDDTDPSELMRTGIDAMLNSLDPYTNYIGEEEIEDFRFMSTGKYGGIGALIGKRKGNIVVLEPYDGYPAQKAGLKAGDQILQIEDTKIGSDKEVSDVRDLLRGEEGTPVKLTIQRLGEEEPMILSLERDQVKVDNVPYSGMVNDHIGYIALTGFTQDAGKEVKKALEKLKKEHSSLSGLILDLRGNPGGRLDEAINVANVFITQKEKIVETRGRQEESRRALYANRPATDDMTPLAVLVNSRSASASEIVAGSIQDLDRGIVVGNRSFGKGLVQNIRPLSYNSQLKVTTAKYYTPSGRCIQAINYADRNEDGSVARIPDSLKNSFTTRNGRTVYDGGGIEPDFDVKKDKLSTIALELNRQGLIFDFATQFVAENKTIASAREFKISDKVYRDFMAYVKKQDFDFETRAEKQLEKLVETVEKESYGEKMKDDLANLESKLESLKDKDMLKHKGEIAELLKDEIVRRYYFKAGAIEASLSGDEDIVKAMEILESQVKYKETLAIK